MKIVITLVVSLCGNADMGAVRTKMDELKKQNPTAKVSIRIDRKCRGK